MLATGITLAQRGHPRQLTNTAITDTPLALWRECVHI